MQDSKTVLAVNTSFRAICIKQQDSPVISNRTLYQTLDVFPTSAAELAQS